MEPVNELIVKQVGGLSGQSLLLVNPVDADVVQALAGSKQGAIALLSWDAGVWQTVRAAFGERVPAYSAWPALSENDGLVNGLPSEPNQTAIITMPKAKERLALLLSLLEAKSAPVLDEIVLVGEKRSGVESAAKALKRQGRECNKQASARHSQWWSLNPAVDDDSRERFWQQYQAPFGAAIHSLPGVFSHGSLDDGTALLLDAMSGLVAERPAWQQLDRPCQALDFGCGAGVISASLAGHLSPRWSLDAIDVDYLAVLSTRRTLAEVGGGIEHSARRVFWQDGLQAGQGPYDLMVTNPPFHQGQKQDLSITRRFLGRCRNALKAGGELILVANRFLPYADLIEEEVGAFQVLAENGRFRVYLAQKSRRAGRAG